MHKSLGNLYKEQGNFIGKEAGQISTAKRQLTEAILPTLCAMQSFVKIRVHERNTDD